MCGSVGFLFVVVVTGSHFVVRPGLRLTVWLRLALNA